MENKSRKKIPHNKIINWVSRNFDYKSRTGKNGPELVIENPFYGNDNKKFNISLTKATCHDWRGDEWAGPVDPSTGKRNCSFVKFVRLYKKCSFHDALKDILGGSEDVESYLRPDVRSEDEEAKRKVSVSLPEGSKLLSESKGDDANLVRGWLYSRGYTKKSIADNELYHLGLDAYWPYFEFDTLVYWQSRSSIGKKFLFPDVNIYDGDKIVGETEGSKGDFLYGFDNVQASKYIILTEAIFDQYTLTNQVLATGGAVLTENQIKKIKILGPKDGIILSPDNDIAGIKSILSNAILLSRHNFKIYYSIPPLIEYIDGGIKKLTKDWNEMITGCGYSRERIREIHDDRIEKLTRTKTIELKKLIQASRK